MSRRSREKRATHRRPPEAPATAPTAEEFAAALAANEGVMGEGAAMAVTCEQFGMDDGDGWMLLADLADEGGE